METSWLDRTAYPFEHHTLEVNGGLMHYVDEGSGDPILFVHGSAAWLFAYRNLIRDLRQEYRCVAPDHLGFGLSAKPTGWGYRFTDHGRNLAALIDHLGLRRFTLVVHDVGGPIGLSYALKHPERIARLLVLNTFCWPLRGPFALAPSPIAALLCGPVGRLLISRFNTELRVLVPRVYGDRTKLTPAIYRQYLAPLARPADRHGLFAFAEQVFGGADWCLWLTAAFRCASCQRRCRRRRATRRTPFREVFHLWQRLRCSSTPEEQHGDRNSMQDPSQHFPTLFKTRTNMRTQTAELTALEERQVPVQAKLAAA